MKLVLEDDILTTKTKQALSEYSQEKSVHTVLNITFAELLTSVWNRIVSFESNDLQAEIKKTLNTEMEDSLCKCFTGRMSRLVNCLNGYDELVNINISDNEQIGQVIVFIRDQLLEKNIYTVEEHKRIVTERLEELGHSRSVIDVWIEFID